MTLKEPLSDALTTNIQFVFEQESSLKILVKIKDQKPS
jgi:hypothetical protein